MQLAMRQWLRGAGRGLLTAGALGLLLGVLGPLGSQSALDPPVKYGFWMGIALAGFGAVAAADRALPRKAPGAPGWRRSAAVALVSALPMVFVAAWAIGLVRPGRSFTPAQLAALFPYTAAIQLLIAWAVAPRRLPLAQSARDEGAEMAAPAYPADFLARLPSRLGREIVALEAEDHYLRVHTRLGSHLVLMRLGDAAAAIDPALGIRVHRGWWVARSAVARLESGGGRMALVLAGGVRVPVSRSHAAAARAAFADRG